MTDNSGVGGTLVFSQNDPTTNFTQIFTQRPDPPVVRSIIIASPHQRFTAWSGELRASSTFRSGETSHRLTALVRGRRSRNRFGGDLIVDAGDISLREPIAQVPTPDLSEAHADLRDSVDQWGVGVSYQLAVSKVLHVNAGALNTHYVKRLETGDEHSNTSRASSWLYNVGFLVRLKRNLDVYATYSRGLEDAGVAPASAANRNAVLDPIEVEQKEVGVRLQAAPSLALLVAAFDTGKPYAGTDPTSGRYDIIGQVRHTGVEASLSGKALRNTTVVLGGVYLRPRVSGPMVDAGLIGVHAVGAPELRLIGNAVVDIKRVRGVSLDAGAQFTGRQAAHAHGDGTSTQLFLEPSLSFDVGLRYKFSRSRLPLTFRAQLLNVFDDYAFDADSSGTFQYTSGRRLRAAVTAEF